MTDRLARTSTGAEKRCRFCQGPIPPDPRKMESRAFQKTFCNKICRGRWHTLNSLQKKKDSYGAK